METQSLLVSTYKRFKCYGVYEPGFNEHFPSLVLVYIQLPHIPTYTESNLSSLYNASGESGTSVSSTKTSMLIRELMYFKFHSSPGFRCKCHSASRRHIPPISIQSPELFLNVGTYILPKPEYILLLTP